MDRILVEHYQRFKFYPNKYNFPEILTKYCITRKILSGLRLRPFCFLYCHTVTIMRYSKVTNDGIFYLRCYYAPTTLLPHSTMCIMCIIAQCLSCIMCIK